MLSLGGCKVYSVPHEQTWSVEPVSLINELKRRNVFKVGIGYLLIAWLLAQILQLAFESFGTPDWATKSVLAILE